VVPEYDLDYRTCCGGICRDFIVCGESDEYAPDEVRNLVKVANVAACFELYGYSANISKQCDECITNVDCPAGRICCFGHCVPGGMGC